MATERITIAELDINESAFIKGAELTKKAIDELVISQKKLKDQGETNSQEYVKQDAQLKKLRSEYTQQKNAINAMQSPYAKLSTQLNIARTNAKNLAAEFGVNSKQARAASAEVSKLDTQLKKIDSSVGQNQRNVGNYSSAIKGITASFLGWTAIIYGTIRTLKEGFNTVTEFEQRNAELASILQLTTDQTKDLRDNAELLGATTAKTATEVTELQVAFARLGFTQSEIIDLTKATINGSIAMNSVLDETATLVGAVVNSMDEFNTIDAPEIIDIMALSTAKSALNFEKLNTQLPIVLGAANALNVPFTEVVATLGKLSDAGIETSTAATALRNIFIESSKRGIEYKDGLAQITNSTDKLKTANEIFGKRAAVSALVIANNTEEVKELDGVLQDAAGTADEMARKQLETLSGSLTLLKSAWDGLVLSIENGSGIIATSIRGTVNAFTALFTEMKNINQLSEIFSEGELSGNWFDFMGTTTAKKTAEASAFLKILNEDFEALKKEGLNGLSDAVIQYTKELDGIGVFGELTAEQIKLVNLQLDRIDELAEKRRALNAEEEKAADVAFEQKESIIDVLVEVDKELNARELQKKSIEELNLMLTQYNDAESKRSEERIKLSKKEKEQIAKDLETFEAAKLKVENDAYLKSLTNKNDRDKAKIQQDADKQIAALAKLKVDAADKLELEKQIQAAADAEKDEIDIQHLQDFNERKQAIIDEINEAEYQKESEAYIAKIERELEQHISELETLQLNLEEKNELKRLLEQQSADEISKIRAQSISDQIKADAQLTASEINTAKVRKEVATALSSALGNLLGDSLGAKLASIAIEAAIQAGLVKIEAGATSGKITASIAAANAAAIAASPLTAGMPFVAANTAQGVALQAANATSAASAISSILTGAAVQGIGAIGSFYEGGTIDSGVEIPKSMRNKGGDDVLIQAKRGEVILNEKQQARAGGKAFFDSIGVPSHNTGGYVGSSTITNPITTPTQNLNSQVEMLARQINLIKVVAIESDITDAQNLQVSIESGANI